MILHLYFARKFLMTFLSISALLFFLIAMVDLIELMRDLADADVSFRQVVQLVMMKSPTTINQILPLIVLLTTIALFVGLARTSEMVVTRASGRSALRSLIAPAGVALLIGLIAVTSFGPIVAALSNRFASLSENYRSGGNAALSISSEGLWLRQGSPDGQSVIRASRSNADASVLYDVTFLTYAPGGGPVQRIEAASAALLDGAWALRDAKSWELATGSFAEAQAKEFATLSLPSTLTLDRIRESLGTSSGVSIWEVRGFIAQLEQAGFSSRRHQVWLQAELARPLFLVALVLIGSAFTMRHTRLGNTGPAVLTAILLGFALYFARSFATILGENGQLSIILATWAVPVAAILLAVGLLLHAEDG
ncbi:MAG: LPS export ABC transporter permease LptG [Aliishimia sp.]